ncbi:MAG: tetratricopeptide repeat protein [Acidobacteriota bacterium]
MKLANLSRELFRRRVPQIMGAYFGAGLALIPFVGFVVSTYGLPRTLLDAVVVIYLSIIPSVFILAYNHGAPGKDPWLAVERVAVPFNLLLTVALLLYTITNSRGAEAKTETVVITDEAGQQQERLVPKAQYRRKLVLFFWSNESGDESLDWLRYGFPMMLERDLEQNRFIAAATPFTYTLLPHVRRAGYEDALDVPVALQRQIADDIAWPRFIDGSFSHDGERFSARLVLYETESSERLDEYTLEGDDPAALVDELTNRLKTVLEIEDLEGLGPDLPVQERLSDSSAAVAKWVDGTVATRLRNDHQAAIGLLREALEDDPSFAAAHGDLAESYAGLGKIDEAKTALREQRKHNYRLSERDQFFVRGREATLNSEIEKSIKIFETLTKLYPDDIGALSRLATAYKSNNNIGEAIDTYRRILEHDASEDWALQQIGDLQIAERDYGAALDTYRQYADDHRDDPEIRFSIARLQQAQGDLDGARASIEEASLLGTDAITPALNLAAIDLAIGDLSAAASRLEEAAAEATIPQDVVRVLNEQLKMYLWDGQIEKAFEVQEEIVEAFLEFSSPIVVEISMGSFVPLLYGLVGREAEGEAWIEDHSTRLSPPFDQLTATSYLLLYWAAENADGLEAHLDAGRQAVAAFSPRPDALAQMDLYRGRALELRGEPAAAATAYRSVLEALESSTLNLIGGGVRGQSLTFHARAAIDAGDLAAAAESLDEVLTTLPAYPHAKVQMARLEQLRGNPEAAREHLAVALAVWSEADPQFRPAMEAWALRDALGETK